MTAPLFSIASPAAQIAAATGFMDSILTLGVRFAGQQELVRNARAHLCMGMDAERAVLLAVTVADCVVFDEMRPTFDEDYPASDEAAPYQRFFAYASFVPVAVAAALSERHPGYEHVLIGPPEQVGALAQGSGRAGLLTPELAYWVDSSKPLPPCCVPRQVLYAALLRCGVNPLAGRSSPVDRHPREVSWPRPVRKSARLARRLMKRTPDPEAILAKSATHWGRLMAEDHSAPTPALLASSGSAANESVILSVSRIVRGSAFVDPGFYFENFRSISECRFAGRTVQDPARAHVLFLCLEPITLCFPLLDAEQRESALAVLERFLLVARSTPADTFVVVLDVTAAPTMSVTSALGAPLPPNVVLYKTCSVTKHQDGGRNYSCGAMTITAADGRLQAELAAQLRRCRSQVGGAVYPIHALNIPRTTRRSVEEKRSRIARLNRAVAAALDPSRQGRVRPYSYHSFLIPPRESVKRLAGETLALALAGGLRLRREFEITAGLRLRDEQRMLAASLREIEYGNSFALPRSRLITQNCPPLDVCPGFRLSFTVLRLCPGYDADEARLVAEAGLAQASLDATFAALIDMAVSLRERVVHEWVLHG